MQYVLTQEEYDKINKAGEEGEMFKKHFQKSTPLIQDLRTKIMELAQFKCYHDLPENTDVYVDEGYCDECPLSFCSNEKKEMKFQMCPHDSKLYSK